MSELRAFNKYQKLRSERIHNSLNGMCPIEDRQCGISSKVSIDSDTKENISILNVFKENKFINLTGENCGKTTLLRWFTWYLSSGFSRKLAEPIGDLIPFFINLSTVKISDDTNALSLITDVVKTINSDNHIIHLETILDLLKRKENAIYHRRFFSCQKQKKEKQKKMVEIINELVSTYDNYTIMAMKSDNKSINNFKELKISFFDNSYVEKRLISKIISDENLDRFKNETNVSLLKCLNDQDTESIHCENDLLNHSFKRYQLMMFKDEIDFNLLRKSLYINKFLISNIAFEIKISGGINRESLIAKLIENNKSYDFNDDYFSGMINTLLNGFNPIIKDVQGIYILSNEHIGNYLCAFYVENQIRNPEYFQPDDEDRTVDIRFSNIDNKMLSQILNNDLFSEVKYFLFQNVIESRDWTRFLNKKIKK